MNTIYLILFFIIGLMVGSFLNVLILRIDNLKSVVNTRSRCPGCKHTLAWNDLIPLVSFFLLKGRCRYCGKKISNQYPMVEFGTGLAFAVLFLAFGLNLPLIYYLLIFSILIVVFVYDLRTQMTPEVFVWLALVLSFLGSWYFGGLGMLSMIYGGLVAGGVLALLVIVSKEKWMGSGDIKIGLILGFLVGYPAAVFGIFSAFLLGSIAGLIYMKIANKTMKDTLPFAPFLILAAYISLLYGAPIVNWYWGSFIQ